MPAKFVIYQDKAKKHRFRFLASNGEIVASGEAYESKAACINGIKSIQKNAPAAAVVDETIKKEPAKKAPAKKAAGKSPAAKKAPAKKAAEKVPAVKKEPVKKAVEKAPAVKKAVEEPVVKKEPEAKPEGLPQAEKADA